MARARLWLSVSMVLSTIALCNIFLVSSQVYSEEMYQRDVFCSDAAIMYLQVSIISLEVDHFPRSGEGESIRLAADSVASFTAKIIMDDVCKEYFDGDEARQSIREDAAEHLKTKNQAPKPKKAPSINNPAPLHRVVF